MDCTIFYSWQSDLPSNTNRNFVLEALKQAVEEIQKDEDIKVEPRIDHDTAGVAGAPDIVQTILDKIERSQIFVCDVSIINSEKNERKTPNPNVLVELGYAMGKMGLSRIIMVMNVAYGGPHDLPFDLRTKRQTTYSLLPDQEKALVRKRLVSQLKDAIKTILNEMSINSVVEKSEKILIGDLLRNAILENQYSRLSIARRYMPSLSEEISAIAPDLSLAHQSYEQFIQALSQSIPIVLDFAKTVQVIAEYEAVEVAHIIYRGFEQLLVKYDLPPGFSGSFRYSDFDFYKFLGHEMFVSLFALLIQEGRWSLISALLDETFLVYNRHQSTREMVSFEYVYKEIELLELYNQRERQDRKISYHAYMLNERHSQGELESIVSMQMFAEADYFLYLRSQSKIPENEHLTWIPWSIIYMQQVPRYIADATRTKKAQILLEPLAVENVEVLRDFLKKSTPKIESMFRSGFRSGPLIRYDWNKIGSQ